MTIDNLQITFTEARDIRPTPRVLHWRQISKTRYTPFAGLPRSGDAQAPAMVQKALSEALGSFLGRMASACAHLGGIGLAAPQIGAPEAIVCIRSDALQPAVEEGSTSFRFLFNPEWKPVSSDDKEKVAEIEACLSVPRNEEKGLRAIERYKTIEASWYEYNPSKETFDLKRQKLEGHPARVFQHEVDHLWGKSIVDRSNSQVALKSSVSGTRKRIK